MNNYSNNKPYDPHGSKEEVKIKYSVIKAVVGRFPNETGGMMELIREAVLVLDSANYCKLTPVEQLVQK